MNEKEQLWYARYLDYINSGLPQQRWCREHGIPQSSLRYWCNKYESFRMGGIPLPDQADLQDISGLTDPVQSPGQFYELICAPQAVSANTQINESRTDVIRISHQGVVMEFPDSIEPSRLIAVAKGLING